MSVIAVQSAVGNHVIDTQPAQARQALAAIEATSRSALTEMRRLLGVLRQAGEPRGSLTPAPGLDGLEATRLICRSEETENVRVLILTTFDLDEYVYAALRAGASGFLLKDTPPNDLLAGIRIVAAGDALLAPSVTRQLISEFVRRPDTDRPPPATLEVLTGREREVLALVARGWSNAEIAERLYLSPATAKTHVGRLLMKLQARDRTQLVVIAYETGLVTPSGP
jgi:DNA-binding NarL/FixJ family response regulator